MDTLHDVMRAISSEHKAEPRRRDHLTVFREFLDHLERASRKRVARSAKSGKSKTRRAR